MEIAISVWSWIIYFMIFVLFGLIHVNRIQNQPIPGLFRTIRSYFIRL